MSKNSKSCGYTGHIRILDRGINETKESFDAGKSKLNMQFDHAKKSSGIVYPEVQCTCKK